MLDVLPERLPWWVAGPGIGLCVVVLYAVANVRMGVSGAWLQALAPLRGRRRTEPWRVVFLVGLVLGALLAGLLSDVSVRGYGDLGALLPPAVLVPVLFVGGGLLGYGARWAGGCTSGHGLSGCSVGSRGSLLATGTFFGVAVVVTLGLHAVSGGRL